MTKPTPPAPLEDNLSPRQRSFVNFYLSKEGDGNAVKAARLAGYKCPRASAWQLLATEKVRAELDRIIRLDPYIASRPERARFLTRLMRNDTAGWTSRLKAAELLAKMSGDMIQKVEASVSVTSWAEAARLADQEASNARPTPETDSETDEP